jgi:hypothetical protein
VDAGKAGFALHWDGISLFANRQPLTLWIMRGYPGYRRTAQVGKRSVHRLLGPYGVVYAWRERQHTYGIVTYPQFDSLAQQLVRAMA